MEGRRDQAAAKNEGYERYDEEDEIKRKGGCRKSMVGCRVIGGRLGDTLGPSRRRRNYAKMVCLVGGNEEGRMRRERWKNCIAKGDSDDQECGGRGEEVRGTREKKKLKG